MKFLSDLCSSVVLQEVSAVCEFIHYKEILNNWSDNPTEKIKNSKGLWITFLKKVVKWRAGLWKREVEFSSLVTGDTSACDKQHLAKLYPAFVSKEKAASVKLQSEYTGCRWSGPRVYLSRRGCTLHASEPLVAWGGGWLYVFRSAGWFSLSVLTLAPVCVHHATDC